MSLTVAGALGIISLVASLTSTGTGVGLSIAKKRRARIAEEEEAKKTADQRKQVQRQEDRSRNLGTLGRQAAKRVAATGAAREKTSLQANRTTPIQAPQAPTSPQAPTPSIGQGATIATTPAVSTPSRSGEIIQAAQGLATVAEGAAVGAAAAAGEREQDIANTGLEELRDQEFERAMSQVRKDTNLQALDFQDAQSALPNRNARSFNQDLVSTFRKFSGRAA